MAGLMSDWLSFWDGPHSIYVGPRHRDVHYRLIAEQIAVLVTARNARVLDYGSGEALHAEIVAAAAGELLLSDGAPSVRAGLAERFAGNAKIRALAPEDVERLPDHCLDLIVLHSVAQYLTLEQARNLLALFRRLLQSRGTLVVSDVIPPHVSAATDAAALLRFSAREGFLFAALAGLARTVFSDYRRLRSRFGLTHYSEAAMRELLAGAGFAAVRATKNIGHNQARLAFIARPAEVGAP
jgi:SAM-dependent methyltransferase